MSDDLVERTEIRPPPREDGAPCRLGEWYWIRGEKEEWLGCVTHVGSNYASFRGPSEESGRPGSTKGTRVHFRDLEETCRIEPRHAEVVAEKIAEQRAIIAGALKKIEASQSALSLGSSTGAETSALATYRETSLAEYKASLSRTLAETLPELQKVIEEASSCMAMWMEAEMIPLGGSRRVVDEAIAKVKKRIGGVELYAGIYEDARRVRDGEPAGRDEPLHVFQRRCYMDEECLANYRVGGMRFKDLGEFDAWVAEDDNFARLFPFPRSAVSFRVRREKAERTEYSDHVAMWFAGKDLDMTTFFYVRNGDQLWRVEAQIDFGESLFPDADHSLPILGGRLRAVMSGSTVERIATEHEYEAVVRQEHLEKHELKKIRKKDRWKFRSKNRYPSSSYVPWDHDTVYYDDISDHVSEQAEEHNRFVLLLQGLFDRSEILSPHLPCKLWIPSDFERAVRLVHDQARALAAGEAPSFEDYQSAVNRAARTGSVMVGQQDFWERAMAEKEEERLWTRYGSKHSNVGARYKPPGDPGPGEAARVVGVRGGSCTFRWEKRVWSRRGGDKTVVKSISVPLDKLLCADGYRPGDYHRFYDDPRTRALYFKWAPLLLLAEEYHAGKIRVGSRPDDY